MSNKELLGGQGIKEKNMEGKYSWERRAEVVMETNQGNEEFRQEYWESPYHKERRVKSKGKGL